MIKTVMKNDSRPISGLYGENESWQITLDSVEKIEAYFESDNSPWFAIYQNNKIDQRINSRYVGFVVYL